jgi:glyoxylase-like metal-dependent hydrolase (beta-lactamase superfamily II)
MLDVFGDGSLWAFHLPGHTPGSMAFLARTADGSRLLVGDNSHTRWGWDNAVEPGSFTADHERNAESLRWLRSFADRHPEIEVYLGHQR